MLYRTLRAEMVRQNVTRDDLAGWLGCSKGTLCADFTGKRSFSMQDVYIIMDRLDLPYAEIMNYFPPNGIDGLQLMREEARAV